MILFRCVKSTEMFKHVKNRELILFYYNFYFLVSILKFLRLKIISYSEITMYCTSLIISRYFLYKENEF